MQVRTVGTAGMITATLIAIAVLANPRPAPAQASREPAPGQLTILQKDGKPGSLCPLEGTSVIADVAGFGARVNVTQTFHNPTKEPIEAVYTFPLPENAAVDRMQMQIGSRLIEAEIKRREEARLIYEAARNAGQSAALLDQERPNIFTQSVANIMPGAKVKITISYVQVLKFEKGEFEFVFPMVVGHRYTANAADPEKISPPIVPKGTRSGAAIDLRLNLRAGAALQEVKSILHQVTVRKPAEDRATITLAKRDEIPNKDFILRYRISTDEVQDAFITHMGEKGGFFTLILMPPKAPQAQQIAPKEVIFVMDQSGSQMGFPIEKSKELTQKLIRELRPGDTFNVMGFNTQVRSLWPEARPLSESNLKEAASFIEGMQANGGTHIREGVVSALQGQVDPDRLRMVVFNTDGYVGDEPLILDTIQKNRDDARIFTFGIGNSVNRYLIEQMAFEGKGDAEYVTLAESADAAVNRFIERTRTPVLTDVQAKFNGVEIQDALPGAIPDVFGDKPVVITGRYRAPGKAVLELTGKLGGEPWSKRIDLDFPANASAPALESLWARQRVDELIRRNYLVAAYPTASKVSNDEIVELALEFGIMTQYTSFVAVEKKVVNVGGKQRTVAVPVEMADGVSYEGIFGRPAPGGNLFPATLARGGFAASKSVRRTMGIVTADAQDMSKVLYQDETKMTPEQKRKHRFETKVPEALRTAKGVVEVEVWLKRVDDALIAKLKKIGMKVDFSDKSLRVAIGTVDAKLLIEVAQLDEVVKIRKLDSG